MKILQVIKTTRGAGWAFNQAKHLKKLGVEIVTVLPNTEDGYAKKYKENGMEIIGGDWSLPITRPWRFFSLCGEIRKTVGRVKPDIIHFHFVTNVLMCRLALKKDKTPRLFQIPGPLHLENALTRFAERITATEVDHWAGSCKKSCSVYLEKNIAPEKVHLAYYGVPKNEREETAKKSILHKEYGIAEDTLIVAMVSYFYKPKRYLGQRRGIKGHEDFIDAMKLVLKKHETVVPMIIGNAWDGAEKYEKEVRKYAEKVLGDRIIFTGYRNDVYDIYPEIDLVVHPSHSENLGGAAESLMLAVPTVSSNVGGFPDIVIPGKTGCLARPKDPRDLAKKISYALQNHDEMKKMAKKGQTFVEELLDLDNTAARVFEIYSEILKPEEGQKS